MERPKQTAVNRHARTGLALFDLARTAGEMATAAAQTFHDRTQRMARAPSARDRNEFLLMGQEKLEAAVESTTRMITEAMAFNQRLARMALGQMQAQTAAWSGAALGGSRRWMNAYSRLAQGAFANSPALGAAVGNALVRSAALGLKPIHGRPRANAKQGEGVSVTPLSSSEKGAFDPGSGGREFESKTRSVRMQPMGT